MAYVSIRGQGREAEVGLELGSKFGIGLWKWMGLGYSCGKVRGLHLGLDLVYGYVNRQSKSCGSN